jgi:hypothetical protein
MRFNEVLIAVAFFEQRYYAEPGFSNNRSVIHTHPSPLPAQGEGEDLFLDT